MRQEALRQAHDDLKKQVEERTAQLLESNELFVATGHDQAPASPRSAALAKVPLA